MELCYIWVSDYKGFRNQGFNFSSKFNFEFNFEKSFLTRNENKKFIKNFFGNDIVEITGIIGKNASGKTNIIELIQYVINGANTIVNTPFFAVFKTKNDFKIFNYKSPSIQNNFSAKEENYDGKIPEINSIFFSNIFDGRRHNFSKKTIDISTNDLLNSQFGENINKNYQKTIQQQIRFIESKEFALLENIEKEINVNDDIKIKPSKVILTSPIWSNIINRIRSFDEKTENIKDVQFKLREFVLSFRKKITDNKSTNSIKYFTAFIVFIDFVLNRDILKFPGGKYKDEREYYEMVNSIFKKTKEDLRIDEIYKYLTKEFAIQIDNNFNVPETHKFLIELDEYNFGIENDYNFKEDIGTYASRRIQFTLNYNDTVGSFLTCYLDAVTNQNLAYSIEWAGISSGHKAYINLFANFHSILNKINEENVIICIDEGDLYFHPKWQTEFLYKIINVLPKLMNSRCQIFLTTHSPFLISDLPKSNLLFVQKNDRIDNLTVIPNDTIDGETFGGNIGDLYLDAFFMQGSLISYFAASKIKLLISRIKNESFEVSNQDRIFISQIGEEIIQMQLNDLIHDKN